MSFSRQPRSVRPYERFAEELVALARLGGRRLHLPADPPRAGRRGAALARALMDDPRIVLADGPTRNPRASGARQVMAPLFTLVNEPREALVVGKHDGSLMKRGDGTPVIKRGLPGAAG